MALWMDFYFKGWFFEFEVVVYCKVFDIVGCFSEEFTFAVTFD